MFSTRRLVVGFLAIAFAAMLLLAVPGFNGQAVAPGGAVAVAATHTETAAKVARQFSRPGYQENKGEWRAMLRMLDKTDPSYRD